MAPEPAVALIVGLDSADPSIAIVPLRPQSKSASSLLSTSSEMASKSHLPQPTHEDIPILRTHSAHDDRVTILLLDQDCSHGDDQEADFIQTYKLTSAKRVPSSSTIPRQHPTPSRSFHHLPHSSLSPQNLDQKATGLAQIDDPPNITKEAFSIGQDSSSNITSSSILTWIHQLPTPPQLSPLPRPATPSSGTRFERGSSESIPSAYLGHRGKRRKKNTPSNIMASDQGTSTPSKSTSTKDTLFTTPRSSNTTSLSASQREGLKHKKKGTPSEAGVLMSEHGMLYEDEAFDRYPEFQEKVFAIVGLKRDKEMKAESVKRLRNHISNYSRSNESTFLGMVWPLIMKDGYYKKMSSLLEGPLAEIDAKTVKEQEKAWKYFFDDEHIFTAMDQEFDAGLLPEKFNTGNLEAKLAKLLKKQTGMKTPKPDFTFGIKQNRLPTFGPIPDVVRRLLTVCPTMRHPFLIVEGKTHGGDIAVAEDQARRGGATLVHAARQLRAEVGRQPVNDGADDETFVFSITIDTNIFRFWVHWHERRITAIGPDKNEPEDFFHMNAVRCFALADEDQAPKMRDCLHNILQWGANARYKEQEGLHDAIRKYAIALREAAQAQPDAHKRKRVSTIGAGPQILEEA